MMSTDAHSLEVQVAEMRGTVITRLDNVAHDIKNLSTAMLALTPRREVDALEVRVAKLEANQNRAVWAIIMSWVAGLGVAIKALGPH